MFRALNTHPPLCENSWNTYIPSSSFPGIKLAIYVLIYFTVSAEHRYSLAYYDQILIWTVTEVSAIHVTNQECVLTYYFVTVTMMQIMTCKPNSGAELCPGYYFVPSLHLNESSFFNCFVKLLQSFSIFYFWKKNNEKAVPAQDRKVLRSKFRILAAAKLTACTSSGS